MRLFLATLGVGLMLVGCSSSDSTTTCTVTAITITGAPASLNVGATATLAASATQQNCTNLVIAWSSSNSALLTVDQSGHITGVAAGGPVTVTASAGGQSATAHVTVLFVPVAAVGVAPDSIILGVGATFQLSSTTRGADSSLLSGRVVTWGSAANGTATVSGTGLVTAVAAGSTTVTATSETINGSGKVFVATPRLAYFWNNAATPGGVISPLSTYSYSLGAGANTVNSSATGTYALTYSNFARAGAETEALFVTAYSGTPGAYCTIGGWSNESASTNCWNSVGGAADTRFDFLAVGSGTFQGRFAYAWVDNASPSAPFAPSLNYRFSSSNMPITVTKTATGTYSVLFAGQGRVAASDREAVMVSSYGGTNIQCQDGPWASAGADLTATVYCFTSAGAAADSRFDILLVSQPRAGATVGYVDADQPANTTAYSPTNSKVLPTGTATVTRTSTGNYDVRLDGLIRSGALKETFQITAVGTTAVRCQSAGWGFDATGVTSSVSCTTIAGVAADSRFVLIGLQ
jgi:hypothetical protein